jgi:transcriptional regulator with XRE-family HTH domain
MGAVSPMKNELKKEIGQRMRKLRKTLGYTQEQIVENFNIGRANYSRIEKGEVHPGALILSTLQNKFNVSLDWLICNNGKMFLRERDESAPETIADFGPAHAEVREMLHYMEMSPMVRHALLGFFLEYKQKNIAIIQIDMDAKTPTLLTNIQPESEGDSFI